MHIKLLAFVSLLWIDSSFLNQVPWSNQAVSLFVLVEEQCFVNNEYFPAAVLHICGLAVKV